MWKMWLSIKTELLTFKGYGYKSSKFNNYATPWYQRKSYYV